MSSAKSRVVVSTGFRCTRCIHKYIRIGIYIGIHIGFDHARLVGRERAMREQQVAAMCIYICIYLYAVHARADMRLRAVFFFIFLEFASKRYRARWTVLLII